MRKGLKMLEKLSDERLLGRVGELVHLERRTTANLVVHLAEVEARELHLGDGSASLFAWCRDRWGFGEDKAYNYVKAVEWVRRWPEMGAMLADGRLSLSGMRVIGPHLGEGNAVERLAEAAGKSKRELVELVARWAPRPDVPARVVKLPPPRGGRDEAAKQTLAEPKARESELALERPKPKHRVEPLSEARYRVQVTVGARVAAKLEEAMAISGHRVASGDYETLLEMALDVFLAAKKKQRFGVGAKRPSKKAVSKAVEQAESAAMTNPAERAGESVEQAGESVEQAGESVEQAGGSVEQAGESVGQASGSGELVGGRGRAIPAEVRRAVVARDGLRCTFVGAGGRCTETRRLELHHDEAFAKGGAHSIANVRVVCQAHNLFVARTELGAGFVARKMAERRTRTAPPRGGWTEGAEGAVGKPGAAGDGTSLR